MILLEKGFKIKALVSRFAGGNVEKGDIGEVVDVSFDFGEKEYCINFPNHKYYKIKQSQSNEKNIEVISQKSFKVFDTYEIGDIVVSLTNVHFKRHEGDLFKILDISANNKLYYKTDSCSPTLSDWRFATQEEKEYFEKGGKNIKGIPTQSVTLFKKGDKVRCIDITTDFTSDCGSTNGNSKWRKELNLKDIYEVESCYTTSALKLKNNSYRHIVKAFRLVEEIKEKEKIPSYLILKRTYGSKKIGDVIDTTKEDSDNLFRLSWYAILYIHKRLNETFFEISKEEYEKIINSKDKLFETNSFSSEFTDREPSKNTDLEINSIYSIKTELKINNKKRKF